MNVADNIADNAHVTESTLASRARMRRRQKRRKRGISGWVRSRRAGQLLAAAMAVITVAYVAAHTVDAWLASTTYGDMELGMAASRVDSILGKPARIAPGGTRIFPVGGKTMLTRHGAEGGLDRFTCQEVPNSLELCPKTLGIRVGTLERELKLKLGNPDKAHNRGEYRDLHYDGLGLTFQLRGAEVSAITLAKSNDTVGFLRQVGWLLIP